MDKKFRDIIFSQVESVVYDKPPGRESLYELLKIATPDLKIHAVDNTSQREHAYKALKILIHPDKHAKSLKGDRTEMHRITAIFQETSGYYNTCCARLAVESPGMSSNNSLGETTWRTNDVSKATYKTKGGGRGGGQTVKTSDRTRAAANHGYDTAEFSNKRDFRPPSVVNVNAGNFFFDDEEIPASFDATEQWPFMSNMVKGPSNPDGSVSNNELAWIMACRVLNMRGAVVHGQAIGRAYQVSKKSNELDKYHSVDEVLRHFGFVCRSRLRNIDDIKAEIKDNGPVVSVSFQLTRSFFKASKYANLFSHKQIDKIHPVIIVGWNMTSTGELWRAQALTGEPFEVGTGQFGISDSVLAPPLPTLETIPWQSQGPYLDLNMPSVLGLSKDWRELRHMSISISATELETMVSLLNGGFQKAIKEKQTIVIRDKNKKAYSRRYTLREVTMGDGGKWKISVSQAEPTRT